MGNISYLRDVLSGKIFNQNNLFGADVINLHLKNINKCSNKFIKHWLVACLVSIHVLFNHILFDPVKGWKDNPFKKNLNHLSKEKIVNAFRLVAGSYLLNFFKQEASAQFIKDIGLSENKFKEEFFSAFNFSAEDNIKFIELNELFEKDRPAYLLTLYNEIFAVCFDGQRDYEIKNSLIFISLLVDNFTIGFNKTLLDIMEGKIKVPENLI
jgi:hypothetical protein